MIYDPRRRALELRQRIIESMTAPELDDLARHSIESDPQPPCEDPPPKAPSK